MKLQGQHGYAMAALLVAMSIMAIMMTVVMPVWKQTAQREKEAELIFRGQQYVHAIGLYQRKSGPGVYPPSVDVLVEQRYLRKKFKDPITGQDFQPLPAVQTAPIAPGQAGQAPNTQTQQAPQQVVQQTPLGQLAAQSGATVAGGVAGVASKSTDTSIRIYNGRTHYNEWEFRFVAQTQTPGATGGRQGGPQRGGPPNQPQGPQGPQGPVIGGVPGGPGRGVPTNRGAQPFGPRVTTIPTGR